MAVYKCKECGGDIKPLDNGLGLCLYCGATQTLPKEKDERINNILNRANDFRMNCDFDRAIYEYEKVLELAETEPEAHWGIFLSKYGIEYVKDNLTYTYKPTIHRISSVSVFDDVDYQATIKYSDSVSSTKYKEDAEVIELLMKELLLLSANQEQYDIFLSYKELDDETRKRTNDSYLAHDLYNELVSYGYKVFFAPKSLGAGLYEPKIYSAIISSKVMIVLGTKSKYFEAVWVKNEWSRFSELIEKGEHKILIPVFKDMEADELPNRIAKYQALDMSNISFLHTLVEMIEKAVDRQSRVKAYDTYSSEEAFLERGFLALEDGDFSQAQVFFEKVLNLNPHNAEAYFGELMVEMKITKQEYIVTSTKYLNEYNNFEKAVRFADQKLKTLLLEYEKRVNCTINTQVVLTATKKMRVLNNADELKAIYDSLYKIKGFQGVDEILKFIHAKLNKILEIEKIGEEHDRQIDVNEQELEKIEEVLKEKVKYYFCRVFGGIILFVFMINKSIDYILFFPALWLSDCLLAYVTKKIKNKDNKKRKGELLLDTENRQKEIRFLAEEYQKLISEVRNYQVN